MKGNVPVGVWVWNLSERSSEVWILFNLNTNNHLLQLINIRNPNHQEFKRPTRDSGSIMTVRLTHFDVPLLRCEGAFCSTCRRRPLCLHATSLSGDPQAEHSWRNSCPGPPGPPSSCGSPARFMTLKRQPSSQRVSSVNVLQEGFTENIHLQPGRRDDWSRWVHAGSSVAPLELTFRVTLSWIKFQAAFWGFFSLWV